MHKELQEYIETPMDECKGSVDVCESVITVQSPLSSISNVNQTVHGSEEASFQDTAVEQLKIKPLVSWNTLEPLKRRLVFDLCPKVLVIFCDA